MCCILTHAVDDFLTPSINQKAGAGLQNFKKKFRGDTPYSPEAGSFLTVPRTFRTVVAHLLLLVLELNDLLFKMRENDETCITGNR